MRTAEFPGAPRLYYTETWACLSTPAKPADTRTMKDIIVGTAGHVDHGKTALIKALTGIDTDRLKEEKERGMTIDLGFASLVLPNGQRVGIVDVPGHERFLKNMLAGAGGIDAVLMVIAADESVMPQTVEHLEILQLLDVRRGVVALTKSDLVDKDWVEVVRDDVRETLAGTCLEKAPVISVSAATGQGLPDLLTALTQACEAVETRDCSGPFRIPVDRVFTLTGFGTVLTGTLISGTVTVGDAVEIMPRGIRSRARQIQVHGEKVESARAGTRVAVNLVGLEVGHLSRGDVCTAPGLLRASDLLDLNLTLLKTAPRPLKHRTRVRFHVGTAELLGRIALLDRDELEPGDQAYVQFQAESPTAAARGDRFVIRSYSPMRTIGGGVIIDPNARKHKRFDAAALSALETASDGSAEELIDQTFRQHPAGLLVRELSNKLAITDADVQGAIDSLRRTGKLIELDGGRFMHALVVADYESKISSALVDFHRSEPLKPGMSREALRNTAARALDSRVFASLLTRLQHTGQIAMSKTSVSLPDHQVDLSKAQRAAADALSHALKDAGCNVPAAEELLQRTGLPRQEARAVLELLVHQGEVRKIADGLYHHSSTVTQTERMLKDYLRKHGSITVSQFRDLTSSSRKYAVPLLEYFDSKRVTRRVGDERVLAKTEVGPGAE